MKSMFWRLTPFILFLGIGLFFWKGLFLNPHHLPSTQVGKKIPHFHLASLHNPQQAFTSSLFAGKISLLNVWASWCQACTEEQIFLLSLAKQGWTIYGLNYKDEALRAQQWLKEWGNPYQLIGSDIHGQVAIDLGVYGAPETFLLDKKGIIRYRHVGILTPEIWQAEFLPRVKQLEKV